MPGIILCFEDDMLGDFPPCPHPDLDENGYCLTCDRRPRGGTNDDIPQ